MRVAPPVVVCSIVLAALFCHTPAASGQYDCACGTGIGQPGAHQSLPPALETTPGENLYWHDPYLGWSEDCQYWPPETLGFAPTWFVVADVLPLKRDTSDDFNLASLGPGGPTVLGTGDFRDDFDAGIRFVVGRALGEWYRIEASYFGSHEWSDSAAVRNTDVNASGSNGNLFSPFTDFGMPPAVGLDYNNLASIRFSSRLNNAEVNLRRRVLMVPGYYETSVLIGGRYMKISDEFGYATASAEPVALGATNDVSIRTSNEMIGFQLGLLSQFLVQPRYWIDFEIKGAIMQNDASQATDYTNVTGGVTTAFSDSAQRDRTSFVGDLSLQVNYQFSRFLTFRVGYSAIWVTGTALGANNFNPDTNTLTLGPAALDHAGDVVYHGPNFGLVFTR